MSIFTFIINFYKKYIYNAKVQFIYNMKHGWHYIPVTNHIQYVLGSTPSVFCDVLALEQARNLAS